ncbi:hypothetical protein [Mameliella sp.]|uniref:hypothetical protein n=1 Tax=Mameliella sp. TaxID=1924940 RepID=UPI003B504D1E
MFADFIKNSGDSQAAWARRLEISPGYLCDLLGGKKVPGLVLAVRIHRLTGGAVPAESWVPDPDNEQETAA